MKTIAPITTYPTLQATTFKGPLLGTYRLKHFDAKTDSIVLELDPECSPQQLSIPTAMLPGEWKDFKSHRSNVYVDAFHEKRAIFAETIKQNETYAQLVEEYNIANAASDKFIETHISDDGPEWNTLVTALHRAHAALENINAEMEEFLLANNARYAELAKLVVDHRDVWELSLNVPKVYLSQDETGAKYFYQEVVNSLAGLPFDTYTKERVKKNPAAFTLSQHRT